MFVKIDKHIPLKAPTDSGVIFNRFGFVRDGKFIGITYYCVDESSDRVLKHLLIPPKYHKDFNCLYMVINAKDALPHTDDSVLTTINIYVNTSKALTKFYNVKFDDQVIPKLKTQTSGRLYSYDQLDIHSSFCAAAGDVWVLDVTQPHSVHCESKEDRTAFVVQTNTLTFDQVKSIINI